MEEKLALEKHQILAHYVEATMLKDKILSKMIVWLKTKDLYEECEEWLKNNLDRSN